VRAGTKQRGVVVTHARAVQDVAAADKELQKHLPSVSQKQFLHFLKHADSNKDGKVNRDEMLSAVGTQAGSLLELGALLAAGQR
jgi:hypothetical protein